MSHRLMEPFATLHFKSDDFGAADVLYHIGHDRRLVNYRHSDRKLSFVCDEENPVQSDLFALGGVE